MKTQSIVFFCILDGNDISTRRLDKKNKLLVTVFVLKVSDDTKKTRNN